MPISAALVTVFDFIIGFCIFIGLSLFYDLYPTLRLLIVPVLIIWTLICSLSVGVLISALNVKYRDFQYIVPFVLQVGFFLCPIVYSTSVIPDAVKVFYFLNPMVPVIEGFRWAILGATEVSLVNIMVSVSVTVVGCYLGIVYFKSNERTFSDYV